MNTLKMTVIAVSIAMSLAAAAYAGSVKLAGDFLNNDNTSEENARFYVVDCKKPGKICASIKDGGFHFDNIFGAAVECEGDADQDSADKPGGKAKACAECAGNEALIVLFCDESSPFCDDGFTAKVKCKGHVEHFIEIPPP